MSAQQKKTVVTQKHIDATRTNIPTAEMQSVVDDEVKQAIELAYENRNPDLDPQLVWRGKYDADQLLVQAPPLYIQEKIHPKALIDDLQRVTRESKEEQGLETPDLFADFNGFSSEAKTADFYQHHGHWTNRMILGDSLQVMASLAEREGLRGKVQCIYLDPPYGIKFNSNFQWSTTSRDVKDGNKDHITREPEMVKAFRDTWRDGIHSYLSYLRDRLIVAKDLLTESGSIFVQIGDENVHRVRAVMDEVFGEENFVSIITYAKTTGFSGNTLSSIADYIVWYAKSKDSVKYRQSLINKSAHGEGKSKYRPGHTITALQLFPFDLNREAVSDQLTSQGASPNSEQKWEFQGKIWNPSTGLHWKTRLEGLDRLALASRVMPEGNSVRYVRFFDDFSVQPRVNVWMDIGGIQSRSDPKVYVVQTATEAIQRCLLMATDPGDLVLAPPCGSGTTAYVAEQWGRRWITIDTSRVSLALARARLMGARYPYYLLADSREGQLKEAEVTRSVPRDAPTYGKISHGFVYERVPHIMLRDIANNAEIDVIWDQFERQLQPLREALTAELPQGWLAIYRKAQKYTAEVPVEIAEWEVPRERPAEWPESTQAWLDQFWKLRIARQKEIDASIAAKSESEYLYDKPYENKSKVRVASPFTVESVSPHRMLHVGPEDEVIDPWKKVNEDPTELKRMQDFTTLMLENLRTAGVQQAHKENRLHFDSIDAFPGSGYVCAIGTYTEGESENAPTRRAAIHIGPEFGTTSREDLVAAAREAGDLQADILLACAFNYDAHATEFERLGKIPVLKARMNADMHMATDLKKTKTANLFVVFGEPDVEVEKLEGDQLRVHLHGVDVFKPQTGEVVSSEPDDIACWMVDTDYNEESFFVRQAYFLGQNDPYQSLKTTLKAEINREAWETLRSTISRPFPRPATGRIAVKVINHLGDEVMKVIAV